MTIVALLGAGIFAKEGESAAPPHPLPLEHSFIHSTFTNGSEHLPAIEAAEGLTLGAVYSRSQASADALAAAATQGPKPDVYFDSPATKGRSLADLLARADIAAVVVSLPILVQPVVITQALAAGKHVLSEKPIAKDVQAATALIREHCVPGKPIWAVAENFRFLEVILYAAERVRLVGGAVTTFSMKMNTLIGDDDKFFNTEWRKVPAYQGGFLLDGGVHFVAGLRYLLGATSEKHDIARVAAFTTLLQPKLAPVDTVQAILTTDKGALGTFCVSFGTEFKSAFEIEVVTTRGAVTLTPTAVTSSWVEEGGGDKKEDQKEFTFSAGVKPEIVAFGASLAEGVVDPRQSPQQALKDLAILEALLASADKGGAPLTVE